MKKLYLFAALATMLAACSENDLTAEKQAQQNAEEGAVMFEAYVNRGTTRAGTPGELTTSTASDPKISLQTTGFGVFAYYTDGKPYSETATPDFMYNQKVSGADWTYTPIKYWPNEFGSSAISEGQDKLTFFAYAPWVDVVPGTGRVNTGTGHQNGTNISLTSGIVGMTSNIATGDPYVKYYVDFDPDECVDLCWGVAKAAFMSSVDDVNSPNNIDAGSPYIDVTKPKITDKINFDFKHALAGLNVTIDADVDDVTHSNTLDGATKIWVRSVTFEGFTDKGSLNLNAKASEGPLWYELSSTNARIGSGSVTIYDGRRDGKEGQANAEASNEKPNNLNTKIVQSQAYSSASTTSLVAGSLPGVTKTAVNLFNSTTDTKPIYVIPTDDNLKITIVYDVETYDPSVAGYLSDGATKGSTIQNAITKEIKIGGSNFKLEAGKVYTIGLHLGMTSVKFDASVTDWGSATADKTDLPVNARGIAVTPANNNILAAENQIVPLTGKDMSGSSLTLNATNTPITSASSVTNGVKVDDETTHVTWDSDNKLKFTEENTELYNRVYSVIVTYTDGEGLKYPSNTITVTQAAGALAYSSPLTLSDGATSFSLQTNSSAQPKLYGTSTIDWREATVKINVAGEDWERVPSGATGKQFKVNENGLINLATAVHTDEKVIIKVQVGDAAEATIYDKKIP